MAIANPLSNPTDIVEVLLKFGLTLNSGGDSRPVDEQINCRRIDPMQQLAACFGTQTPDQNKDKVLLGKYVMKELHARGMIVQEDLEFFFAPALTAQTVLVRGAGCWVVVRTRSQGALS